MYLKESKMSKSAKKFLLFILECVRFGKGDAGALRTAG